MSSLPSFHCVSVSIDKRLEILVHCLGDAERAVTGFLIFSSAYIKII